MNDKLPVVWTNDDIGFGNAAALGRQLELLDAHQVPGVFFVIPKNARGEIDQDEELLAVIEAAKKRGHEFYQHGYLHFAFECGIPCLDMFNLDQTAKRKFDADRDGVEALHTLEALVEMLENGQRIWRRAFGESSTGFRPGWGSYCGNLYKALHILGYQWVSSRIPSMTAYLQHYGSEIEFYEGVQPGPHRLAQGIMEYPIGPEIAWRVPNRPDRIDQMVELGLRHFEAMEKLGEPMLMVSHFHGLGFVGNTEGCEPDDGGTGYAVYRKFFPALAATGRAQFMGMKELTACHQ